MNEAMPSLLRMDYDGHGAGLSKYSLDIKSKSEVVFISQGLSVFSSLSSRLILLLSDQCHAFKVQSF